jgi:hypothetical protein
VEIFRFDRGEKVIDRYASAGFRATRIAAGDGHIQLTCLTLKPVTTGWGVRWEAGEEHTSGTETGLVALAVEAAVLDLFEPQAPDA